MSRWTIHRTVRFGDRLAHLKDIGDGLFHAERSAFMEYRGEILSVEELP